MLRRENSWYTTIDHCKREGVFQTCAPAASLLFPQKRKNERREYNGVWWRSTAFSSVNFLTGSLFLRGRLCLHRNRITANLTFHTGKLTCLTNCHALTLRAVRWENFKLFVKYSPHAARRKLWRRLTDGTPLRDLITNTPGGLHASPTWINIYLRYRTHQGFKADLTGILSEHLLTLHAIYC